MADQAERVILEAEDQVTPVVNHTNASLDSFEKKAESSHGKVIRITDQTRSSVQRLIASLEKQAEAYGKSGVERLICNCGRAACSEGRTTNPTRRIATALATGMCASASNKNM